MLAISVASALSVVAVIPTASAHPHYLTNPGTCAQLANSDDTGGPHPENNTALDGDVLHNTVHLGTAGTTGFDQPSNPVDADKFTCP